MVQTAEEGVAVTVFFNEGTTEGCKNKSENKASDRKRVT